MKTEHFEAIKRAKMHGIMPSMLAHELLVRDLVDAAMFEWQNIQSQTHTFLLRKLWPTFSTESAKSSPSAG